MPFATQTARSTEEIARHISEVRTATGSSVAAVQRIEQTISDINAMAGIIASAVEEQGAATAEIARNAGATASAANEMTRRIGDVSSEAERTGQRSAQDWLVKTYAAMGVDSPVLTSTVIYGLATAATRNPALVLASLYFKFNLAAALLEGAWALIALWGLGRLAFRRRAR